MAFRLKTSDYKTLESIAEYRIITTVQIAALLGRNRQSIWRRLRELEKHELLRVTQREFGRRRGRPEIVLSLSEHGVDVLKEKGVIGADVKYEAVIGDKIHCRDHQLMLNWFRIHLNHVEKVLPNLNIRFLAYSSPFLQRNTAGYSIIADFAPVEGSVDEVARFTPDAVFSITDTLRGITVLFFLEVDCGTETIASPNRNVKDVRQKIVNYGAYFDSFRYKRYEDIWDCKLEGFRLLFLTNTLGRLASLSKLVEQMQPSGFIWLTELSHVFHGGVSAEIWVRGGKMESSPESILDSLCCRAPLP